jgi:cobalt/nickel transport system permease protein
MSHIHLPDGVIPFVWWIGGYIAALLVAVFVLRRIDKDSIRRKIPIAAVMAAVMLITMSVPLGFIPFHLNLSALAGILMGPGLGFVIAFVVNLFMAMMGHGGITVVGLNTLIIGAEAVLAFFIFSLLHGKLQKVLSSGISVVLALVVSISLMIAVVGLSGAVDITGGEAFLAHDHDHGHEYEEKHEEEKHAEEKHAEEKHEEGFDLGFVTLTGWTAFLAVVISGMLLESVLTALIVGFLAKVRPDMLEPAHRAAG